MVIAHRQARRDVEEQHAHAHGLGEHADLPADVAVAHDAQRLAADLVGPGRDLAPLALVHLADAVAEVAREHHDLGHDELGHAARVRERRVEDRDSAAVRAREIDLVGADAEAADASAAVRAFARTRSVIARLAADADHVNVLDARCELVLAEGARERLEVEGLAAEDLVRARVNVLQEENLDPILRERTSRWGCSRGRMYRGCGRVRQRPDGRRCRAPRMRLTVAPP